MILNCVTNQRQFDSSSLICRAAEFGSKTELESVGVDRFGQSWSRSWSRHNFANSDSGQEPLIDNQ